MYWNFKKKVESLKNFSCRVGYTKIWPVALKTFFPDFNFFSIFLFSDFALAINFIYVIIKFSVNTTTKNVWCLHRWRTIRFWNDTQAEVYRELHQTFQIFQRQIRRRFSRTDTTMECYQTFHRRDLRIMTWTTTKMVWMEFRHRSELQRTWSKLFRATEISNIHVGRSGMAKHYPLTIPVIFDPPIS